MHNTEIVPIAVNIVRQAALLARRIQKEMISPALNKADRSPVTVADFAIQALVARRLLEAFPGDPLVAEEDAAALRSSPLLAQVTAFVAALAPEATPAAVCDWIDRGRSAVNTPREDVSTRRYWLLDPIDGTKGFLRGGQYAVALALMIDNQAQIGVLGCPELDLEGAGLRPAPTPDTLSPSIPAPADGCLVYAQRGQGTWVVPLVEETPRPGAPVRLHVSERSDPAQARLLRSFEAGHTNVDQIEQFSAALGIHADPVLMDSQVKYAVLAAGQGDLLLRLLSPERPDYREKAWDQAAGALVVAEAGGRTSDLDGKPFDFSPGRELVHNRGVLVSNGKLHPAALRALKDIGAA